MSLTQDLSLGPSELESKAAGDRLGSVVCVCLLWTLLVGCAAGRFEVVDAGRPVNLGMDEGLLIVQIDSDIAIDEIFLDSGPIATGLARGRSIWIVRAPAGRYSWSRVEWGESSGLAGSFRIGDAGISHQREFEFDVTAGQINYPGELIIRRNGSLGSSENAIVIRNRNRSAMAVRRLQKIYPALIDGFPLRYAGSSGDGFLEFFTRERNELSSDAEGPRR